MKSRLFVAIELPAETREAYREHMRRLAPSWPTARWTRPENLHLTVCFLGGVEDGRLPELTASLETAARDSGAFILSPADIELAPPGRRPPTMIWAELRESPDYARLSAAIRRAVGPFAPDMPAAKPAAPHVTLARFAGGAGAPEGDRPAQPPRPPRPFAVSGFSLVESRLASSGPTYHEVKKFFFIKSV